MVLFFLEFCFEIRSISLGVHLIVKLCALNVQLVVPNFLFYVGFKADVFIEIEHQLLRLFELRIG